MKYETRKQLKNKLEALKRENMFLHRGIDSREQVHDIACEQRDRAMAETQELFFLLIILFAVVSTNLLRSFIVSRVIFCLFIILRVYVGYRIKYSLMLL